MMFPIYRPHIYRNLSEMTPKEAVSVLQERLRSTGLLFNGQVPTQSEVGIISLL